MPDGSINIKLTADASAFTGGTARPYRGEPSDYCG
jgi:hypothetical protein